MIEARKEREIAFHNLRVQTGTRGHEPKGGEGVSKYYSVVNRSRAFFWDVLQGDCGGKRVLEYGCGTGSYAFSLAQQQARVTGIDISDVAVQKATREAAARGL